MPWPAPLSARCRSISPRRSSSGCTSRGMVKLSVNVNKVATLRNARGGTTPSVLDAVRICVDAGAPGITVHPRADLRHITPSDVREISAQLRGVQPEIEFNIEG